MSSADKRSVHTDALDLLGRLLLSSEGERDAIHIAVEPVIAGEDLQIGQRIGRLEDGTFGSTDKILGIVDPFIDPRATPVVKKGSKFLLILLPRTITSLTHAWSHPDFQ